ncbi:hypothetical protein [Streptomyces rubiginosohelvolus]
MDALIKAADRACKKVRVQNKQEAGRRIVERTARTRTPIGCDAGGVPGRPAHQRAPEASRHTLRDRVVALVLLRQPQIPEQVIHADPDAWCRGDLQKMGVENHEEWRAVTRNPDVVRAMLEDCRAGLTIDREHEETDHAGGTRIRCPLLVLWSLQDDLEEDPYGDPRDIWQHWAHDVQGHGIDSDHHMAEEAPRPLSTAIGDFFTLRLPRHADDPERLPRNTARVQSGRSRLAA